MTNPFQNILVGLAGAETDAGLIGYAAQAAQQLKPAHMHFVHVLAAASPAEGAAEALSHEAASERIELALAAEFAAAPAETQRHRQILRGQRIDELLSFAATHGTDLIMVGHRQSRSGRRSLARRLAMKAPCSVWMAPEGSAPGFDRILAPIDFSEASADALGVATELAAACGTPSVAALHVYFNEAKVTYEGYDAVIREHEQAAFARFIAPINRHGVEVRPIFEEGANVAHVVNRLAEREGINLIVMGTRGRSRSAAVLLGSETEQTIIESRIPVLAVKHFGARLGLLQSLLDKRFLHRSGSGFTM